MSRFLDRMIAGARGPVSNVRPVLRPFFLDTTSPRDTPAEEVREVSSHSPSSRVPAPASNSSVARNADLRNDVQSPIGREQTPEPLVKVAAEREVYRPLVLETRHVEQVIEQRVASIRNESLPQKSAATTAEPTRSESALPATETSRAPLTSANFPEHVVQIETRAASQPVQRIPTAPNPPPPAQDQIEIHVGRIEIIAATPPAAPVAAPRRARSSINLAEYLKRGERA